MLVKHLKSLGIPVAQEPSRLVQVGYGVTRQVLYLHKSPCPASCAIGSVKLQQSVYASVAAASATHRLVFFYGGLGHELFELQHLFDRGLLHSFEYLWQDIFSKGLRKEVLLLMYPVLELLVAAGIGEPCELTRLIQQSPLEGRVELDCLGHEPPVDMYAAIVDALIDDPQALLLCSYGVFGETPADLSLGHDIAEAILLEGRPSLGRVLRQIAGAAAVGHRWAAGLAKVRDEGFADAHLCLILIKAQHL